VTVVERVVDRERVNCGHSEHPERARGCISAGQGALGGKPCLW